MSIIFGNGIPEQSKEIEESDICEIRALMRYARDKAFVDSSLNELERLVKITAPTVEQRAEIDQHYGDLCAITYRSARVTGRTVMDSVNRAKDVTHCLFGIATICFIVAVFFSNLKYLVPDTWFGEGVWVGALELMAPALWGIVGMSVFLITTYSEIAEDSRFDSRRVHGIGGRLFIGAVFGFMLVQFFGQGSLFTISLGNDISIEIGRVGLAFFAGLGAKSVYEVMWAFIRTMEQSAKNILKKLENVSAPKDPPNSGGRTSPPVAMPQNQAN